MAAKRGTSSTSGKRGTTGAGGLTPMQMAAGAFGVVFLLLGVLGFVPGVTQNTDQMEAIGHESEALLLGVFRVNILHNILHLAFGVLGLVATRAWSWARTFLLAGGAIYLVLFLYGLVIDLESDANFAALNTADNWLHLGLAVAMIGLALLLPKAVAESRRR